MSTNNIIDNFNLARSLTIPKCEDDYRDYWIGCLGVRKDGAIVFSKNGAVIVQSKRHKFSLTPYSHAEGRITRKIGRGGTIFLVRILKDTLDFAISRPCKICQNKIKASYIDKVYYTINQESYGLWSPIKNEDRIFTFK